MSGKWKTIYYLKYALPMIFLCIPWKCIMSLSFYLSEKKKKIIKYAKSISRLYHGKIHVMLLFLRLISNFLCFLFCSFSATKMTCYEWKWMVFFLCAKKKNKKIKYENAMLCVLCTTIMKWWRKKYMMYA